MMKHHKQGFLHPNYRQEDATRLLELCYAGMWSIDSELRTTFVNARMAEMLGYSPQEMLGRTLKMRRSTTSPERS
jgi:PAS domain S-box-containing protein